MMISPETFYEENLKGKSPEQIKTVIFRLKKETVRLKKIMEDPDYNIIEHTQPDESAQIWCVRQYLETAIQAYIDCGGNDADLKETVSVIG